MFKNILPIIAISVFMMSCSSIRPLSIGSSKRVSNTVVSQNVKTGKGPEVKFIDDIVVTPEESISSHKAIIVTKPAQQQSSVLVNEKSDNTASYASLYTGRSAVNVELATALQFKYSILLNTEVEQLTNLGLLRSIDQWYGTRYRYGGSTKRGIDCSAFVQAVFNAAFSASLPRTARGQYNACQKISRTELKEGDLVFFNTTGGVSHVGIYLQNNKFAHASVSNGVTISDMYSAYYLKRYIGAGRLI